MKLRDGYLGRDGDLRRLFEIGNVALHRTPWTGARTCSGEPCSALPRLNAAWESLESSELVESG